MSKLFRAVLLSAVCTLLLSGPLFSQDCPDITQRDKVSDFQTKIEKARSSALYLFVENSITLGDENDPFQGQQVRIPFENFGRGVVIEGNENIYIATLSHVVRFDAEYVFNLLKQSPKYEDRVDGKVMVSKSHKIFASNSYNRDEAVEVKTKPIAALAPFTMSSGREDAIVLLEVPKDLIPQVESMNLVESSKCLGINTAVWQVGGELTQDKDFGFNQFDVIPTSVTNTESEKFFKTLRPSWNGASGSPIFAYHDGEFKVVGITQGWTGISFKDRALPTQSLIYKIDPVVEFLDEF